jgi:hypothetical protein
MLAWMKHKRVPPALAVPVLATALFFAPLAVQPQQPASTQSAPDFKTSFDRPLYDTREITPAHLVGRALWELTLLRNTIYARAGNTFRKKWLADYFNAQPQDQLKDLSRRDLRLLRNAVYARRGRPFRSDLLRAYFESTEW